MIDCTSAATPHALTPYTATPLLRACQVTACLMFVSRTVVLAVVLTTLSLLLIIVQYAPSATRDPSPA